MAPPLRCARPDRSTGPDAGGRAVLELTLSLHPIAGFKGETSEDGDPDDARAMSKLRVTDDARLLPLYLRVHIAYMPLVVRFEKLCPALGACPD